MRSRAGRAARRARAGRLRLAARLVEILAAPGELPCTVSRTLASSSCASVSCATWAARSGPGGSSGGTASGRSSQRSASSVWPARPGSTESACSMTCTVAPSAGVVKTGESSWPPAKPSAISLAMAGRPPRRRTRRARGRSTPRRRRACARRVGVHDRAGRVDDDHRHRQRVERLPEEVVARGVSPAGVSTGCQGVHAASRSAAASRSPDVVSITQALASDETAGGSAVCCGTKTAIEAPSGDVRSADNVRSSASVRSRSRTAARRAAARGRRSPRPSSGHRGERDVVAWPARIPCSRDVRSLVVETKSTLSPAALVPAPDPTSRSCRRRTRVPEAAADRGRVAGAGTARPARAAPRAEAASGRRWGRAPRPPPAGRLHPGTGAGSEPRPTCVRAFPVRRLSAPSGRSLSIVLPAARPAPGRPGPRGRPGLDGGGRRFRPGGGLGAWLRLGALARATATASASG